MHVAITGTCNLSVSEFINTEYANICKQLCCPNIAGSKRLKLKCILFLRKSTKKNISASQVFVSIKLKFFILNIIKVALKC